VYRCQSPVFGGPNVQPFIPKAQSNQTVDLSDRLRRILLDLFEGEFFSLLRLLIGKKNSSSYGMRPSTSLSTEAPASLARIRALELNETNAETKNVVAAAPSIKGAKRNQ
jgi:hypothetical protein